MRGFHISYRDPDLALFRGSLVLKDITLHQNAVKNIPLLFLSNLSLKIDLSELIWKQVLWGEGGIRNGRAIIYGDRQNSVFEKLNSEFDVDLSRLRIRSCDGESNFGYHMFLTGEVRWDGARSAAATTGTAAQSGGTDHPRPRPSVTPPAFPSDVRGEPAFPEFHGDLRWAEQIAYLFHCTPVGDKMPKVELEFIWDETRPRRSRADGSPVQLHQLGITGTLEGTDFVWQNLPIEQMAGAFRVEDGQVEVASLEIHALPGAMNAVGIYDLESDLLVLNHVVSTIDPIAMMRSLDSRTAEALSSIEYESPPSLRSESLSINFRDPAANEINFEFDVPEGLRYRDAGDVLKLDSLSGSVAYGNPSELRFGNLTARVNGLKVTGQATLRQRQIESTREETASAGAGAPTPPRATRPQVDGKMPARTSLVKTLNNLLQLESESGQEPHLALEVLVDPSQSAPGDPGLDLKGSFEGSNFSWHGRQIDSATLDIAFADGLLEISRLQFDGLGGALEARGSYHRRDRKLTIPALVSTVDLSSLKRELALELPGLLEAIEFPAAPTPDMEEFELQLGDPVSGNGRIRLGADEGFTLRDGEDSITAENFQVAMSWNEPRVLSVERATGKVGDLDFDVGGSLRWDKPAPAPAPATQAGAQVPANIPRAIPVTPVATPEPEKKSSLLRTLNEYLTVEAKSDPLKVVGKFAWNEGGRGQPAGKWYEPLAFDAEITGRDFEWRGFSVRRSVGKIALRNSALEFLPFKLETADGTIDSRATYELASQRLRIATLQLTIDPIKVIDQLGIPVSGSNGKIKFLGSPTISGNDILLDFADTTRSSGALDVSKADGISLLTRTGREARLSNVRGELVFADGVIETRAVTAEFLKGRARFDLRMEPRAAKPSYSVNVDIDGISIAAVNEWLNSSDPVIQDGTFDLNFVGKGIKSLDSLTGNGQATIGSDNHSAGGFPIVSGLVGTLEGFFPVLRRNSGWDLDLPFTVSAGKIQTTNTRLSSKRVQATIRGSVDWINDKVDLVADVNLRGLIGVVTNLARPFRSGFASFSGRGPSGGLLFGGSRRPRGGLSIARGPCLALRLRGRSARVASP